MSENGDRDNKRERTDSDLDDDWVAASIFNPPRTSIKQKSSGTTTTIMATPLKTTERRSEMRDFNATSDRVEKQGWSVSSPESSLQLSAEENSKIKRKKQNHGHSVEILQYDHPTDTERSDSVPKNWFEKHDLIPTAEGQDALPIKFSISHLDDDASFTEYLINSSPKGSFEDAGLLPPSSSFQDSVGLFPSPFQMPGDENFDFEEVGINAAVKNSLPLPKLNTPPPTPQRASDLPGNILLSKENYDLEGTKLDHPPPTKKIVGKSTKESSTSVWVPWSKIVSTPPRPPMDDNFDTDMNISPYRIDFAQNSGPNQHRSPGRTIYNVPSKSPSRIGQQHSNIPPNCENMKTPQFSKDSKRKRHESRENREDSPAMPIAPTPQRSNNISPRAFTRGETKRERKSHNEHKTPHKRINKSDLVVTPIPSELPPAVSNESTSPLLMHRVRENNTRSPPGLHPSHSNPSHHPACGSSNGGSTCAQSSGYSHDPNWLDSLHMAPLPPFVARQVAGEPPSPWTRHEQSAPTPSIHQGSSGWNHNARRHPYYAPYYHPHMPPPPDYGRNHSLHTHQVHSHRSRYLNIKIKPEAVTSGNSNQSEPMHWRQKYHQLSLFKNQFGHCNVPIGYGAGTSWERLHTWVVDQRYQYGRMIRGELSTMTPARASALSSLGFSWNCSLEREHTDASNEGYTSGDRIGNNRSNSSWEKWISLLKDYKFEFGNVDVPLKYDRNPSLGTFVNRQRTEYRKMQAGKPTSMTAERVRDLNLLGFTWAVRESHTSWEDRFQVSILLSTIDSLFLQLIS